MACVGLQQFLSFGLLSDLFALSSEYFEARIKAQQLGLSEGGVMGASVFLSRQVYLKFRNIAQIDLDPTTTCLDSECEERVS